MGWGDCGTDSKGRPIGHVFEATCDHPGCEEKIDRGLYYACGGMHGQNDGDCEGYFCAKHLISVEDPDERLHSPQLCEACKNEWNAYPVEDLLERVKELEKEQTAPAFQTRVKPWMDACFGPVISGDKVERNHRFLEEALELVQACGCSREDCLQLVDYVYGRPTGEPSQEVGGVMVTLAALCLANSLDMHQAAEVELARVWTKIDVIRAKQAAKPRGSALPVSPSYNATDN